MICGEKTTETIDEMDVEVGVGGGSSYSLKFSSGAPSRKRFEFASVARSSASRIEDGRA